MSEFAWALSFLRPYRGRSLVIVALALTEIGLAAMAPWPMKAIVDNVFGGRPFLRSLRHGIRQFPRGRLVFAPKRIEQCPLKGIQL